MKNGKSVLCVALKKGEKYVFEATDDVMYIDEIVSKLVPFDQCRPSWWDKAYKEGWNDAINHSKIEVGDERDCQELRDCPFCGASVYIEKKPLWRTYNDGTTHGYVGCYEFEIYCHNCGCNLPLKGNDTIYFDEKTAKENAIKGWNGRVDNG